MASTRARSAGFTRPPGALDEGRPGEARTRIRAALRRDRQLAQYRRALKTLPGGTNSNFRAWGESTIYVDRGKGGRVWDVDGNEYIDLRMGYGPVILGHGDDRVDDYVNQQMRKGVSFSLTSEDEVRAMELVVVAPIAFPVALPALTGFGSTKPKRMMPVMARNLLESVRDYWRDAPPADCAAARGRLRRARFDRCASAAGPCGRSRWRWQPGRGQSDVPRCD